MFIPQIAVIGATAGAIPALVVLKTGSEVNKMEYIIVFCVVAMMGGYVLILDRCLQGI